MDYQIDKNSKSDILRLSLNKNEDIFIRPKSIVSRTYSLKEKISNKKTLWDRAIENDRYVLKRIHAENKSGVITIAPPHPGTIENISVQNKIFVESSSYLASNSNSNLNLDKKKFFKTNESDIIEIDDVDSVFVSGCNGMFTIELSDGQQTVINEQYLIAFDSTIEYSKMTGSLDSTHILKGPGKVYLHSRRPYKRE